MSFVRAKEIPPRSGNWYDYEVKCILEDGKPRQKVIQYLGKHGPDYSGKLIANTGKPVKTGSSPSRGCKTGAPEKVAKPIRNPE
jgi:hypothetical protein